MSLTLTYEREGWWKDEERAVAVHCESDGKVHGQTAQNKERVNRCPVRHL